MATLTIRQVEKRTGLHKDTIRNHIKSGKVQATLQPTSNGKGEYVINESELTKLPKPYKKHNQTGESEVPQGANFTAGLPLVKMRVIEFLGSPEQAREFQQTLQAVG